MNINLKPLEEALSKHFGFDVKLHTSHYAFKGVERVSLQSNDIKEHSGLWSKYYKHLHITDFGSGVVENPEEHYFWMNLNLSFTYSDGGGSNGHRIGYCRYHIDKDEWEIVLV